MSTDPRPGMIRFNGAAVAYLVAICHQCDIVLPFESNERRIQWAVEHHDGTGHAVEFAVDVRPDPTKPFAFITRETQQQQQSNPSWYRWQNRGSIRDPLLAQGTDNQVVSMKSESEPKKMNARERRRARREGLQRGNEPAKRDSAKYDDVS